METMKPTPESEIEVTKVEVKSEAPAMTQETIEKFCKAAKMLWIDEATIAEIRKQLEAKLSPEKPAPADEKKNFLSDLLK